MKRFMFVAVAVAVAGCSSGAEITQPPIAYKATKRLATKGDTSFTARTFVKEPGKAMKEVVGANCTFSSREFRSNFNTPAEVLAPNLNSATPTASISCAVRGEEKYVIMKPYNKTIADIDNGTRAAAANHGLLGAVIGGIAAGVQKSRRNPADDVYAYRNQKVTFETGPK